jgi:DNA-binding XRE family transcriptional regulator
LNNVQALAARADLELTTEELAEMLAVSERKVIAWEAGEIEISSRLAKRLVWKAANARQEHALVRSGLPECQWVNQVDYDWIKTGGIKGLRARIAEVNAHAAQCPTCLARERYVTEQLPPLPEFPKSHWQGFLFRTIEGFAHLPTWVRTAATVGLIVGAIVLVRFIIAALTTGFSLDLLVNAARIVGLAVFMGTVGGITYTLCKPLKRLGPIGHYLTGVACVLAYLLALAVPLALFTDDPAFREPALWIAFVVTGVFFGLYVGHQLRKHLSDQA